MKKIYFLVLALCVFNGINAQIVDFSYSFKFKSLLVNLTASDGAAKDINGNNIKIDTNDDGEIQVSEALNVYQLNIDNFSFTMTGPYEELYGIDGISYFTNLTYLNCRSCAIENLDVSKLKNLVELNCDYNPIKNLNVVGLTNLKILRCQEIEDDFLDLSGLSHLEYLNCDGSDIKSLDLSPCTNLKELRVSYNNYLNNISISGLNNLELVVIQEAAFDYLSLKNLPNLKRILCDSQHYNCRLEISNLNNLEELNCEGSYLSSLSIIGTEKLKILRCGSNRLTGILDFSDYKNLTNLDCSYNLISGLLLKNGTQWSTTGVVSFHSNPNLKYICVEDNQYDYFRNILYRNGVYTVGINSYCSFTPGGVFYTIQGNSKLDINNDNVCDNFDIIFPNMKLNITDGATAGSFISDSTGNYLIPVQAGTQTITPVIENPTFFTVSPTTLSVTFPTQSSPFAQDFCITPNGIHSDLEVSILPIIRARPGFDAGYKITYRNKGNQTQSGSVNLTFDDAVLDLVVANPITSTQTTNNLYWNFTNLLPFESREIGFVLNVNSPMEIPAVNLGSILTYTSTVTSDATDETPIDNSFAFNQTVVNSLDPNDKTCLEGTIISPSLIGQYVHYMIRFENTGTFPAQNIVVTDRIDLSKFDISTLIPTSASHSYITKISEGNKVEFIFENIMLPFDDANNDGYIAFKIKTLPTLVVGDTFENEANIYFDYNFPVLTNKASSTFKTLGTQDFEFSNYFTLYPNPAQSVLNISTKETIEMQSISIYNTLGQLVLVVPNAEKVSKIDVSNLTTGNYFIKINSDKGTSNTRFIKD